MVAVARSSHSIDGSVEVSRERPHGREESDTEPAALGLSHVTAEVAPVTGVSSYFCAAMEVRNCTVCLI